MQDAPTPPPAPDPVKTAQAQRESNVGTAVSQFGLNATNQITPEGSLSYKQIGKWEDGTPRFEATTALSPEQERLRQTTAKTQQGMGDIGNEQIQRISAALNKPADFGPNLDLGPKLDLGSGLNLGPGLNLGAGPDLGPRLDLGSPLKLDTGATEARTMELARKRLDPMLAQREEATRARLFNSGIMPGTEAYRREMSANTEGNNDAINQLILGGHDSAVRDLTTEYGADQSRRMGEYGAGQEQAKYGYEAGQAKTTAEYAADQARRQSEFGADQDIRRTEYGADQTQRQVGHNANLAQTKMTRDQMFNEIASLLSGSQINMPNFQSTPQPGVAPTDFIGAQQQSLNQQNVGFNAANEERMAMINGMFGLGKSALGAGGMAMGGWGKPGK